MLEFSLETMSLTVYTYVPAFPSALQRMPLITTLEEVRYIYRPCVDTVALVLMYIHSELLVQCITLLRASRAVWNARVRVFA